MSRPGTVMIPCCYRYHVTVASARASILVPIKRIPHVAASHVPAERVVSRIDKNLDEGIRELVPFHNFCE